jgi:hypothetical protein
MCARRDTRREKRIKAGFLIIPLTNLFTIHCSLLTINCLEKVLHLGKPQDRTFRCSLLTINY